MPVAQRRGRASGPAGDDLLETAERSATDEEHIRRVELDEFLIAIGTQAPESQQIDVLNIFNDSSQADGSGTPPSFEVLSEPLAVLQDAG